MNHFALHQKLTQYYKSTIPQQKKKERERKKKMFKFNWKPWSCHQWSVSGVRSFLFKISKIGLYYLQSKES